MDVLAGDANAAQSAESEFVRPPPAYPDGLHEPAKADRTGPFWSSLGEPDVSTGIRPSYLRRDDWHISSTYTAEERAAVVADEQAWAESVRVLTPDDDAPVDDDEDDEGFDPFVAREYMELEAEKASGALPSKFPMPNSWQEYQLLQEKLAALTVYDGFSEAQRKEATVHEQNLADFYPQFKDILAQGWKMLNNVEVEAAVKFISQYSKADARDQHLEKDEEFNPPE